jgi:ketosteroid isomerase-like protein
MTNPESLAGRQAMHEDRIRELMAEWLDAVRRKDSAAMMRHYAADVVVLDAGGLQNTVRATVCYRREGDHWLVVHEHASVPIAM